MIINFEEFLYLSISVEENLSSSANLANLLHRLDHSDLVVHQHHTDLIKRVTKEVEVTTYHMF